VPRLGGDTAMQQFLYGILAEARGDARGSAEALRYAYLVDPDSPTLLRVLSRAALHAGDTETAIRFATKGLELDPHNARLRFLRASIYQALGQNESALPDLEEAASADSSNGDYALAVARQYERLNKLEAAREAYERAFRHYDPEPDDEMRLAVILGRLGRVKEAMPILDRLREENPDQPGVALTWAWIADDMGRHDEAAPVFAKHLEAHPDDRLVRRRLIHSLITQGKSREALPHARALYARSGDLSDARVLAALQLRLEEYGQARDLALEVSHRGGRGDYDAASFAVSLLSRAKESGRAVALAKSTTDTAPRDYRAWLLYADALSDADKRGDAGRALDRAQGVLPDSAGALTALGRAYVEVSNTARAESLFQRALDRGADTAATWYDIATARERAKDVDGAERAIQEVLRRQPDNSQALNFLGYLYADYNHKVQEAVPLLRRALELDPDNGFIMDSLGWAYYRIGSLDSAKVELQQALRASGEDPTILEHLGDVFAAMNQVQAARAQYRRALELKPENPPLRAKLEKLR